MAACHFRARVVLDGVLTIVIVYEMSNTRSSLTVYIIIYRFIIQSLSRRVTRKYTYE